MESLILEKQRRQTELSLGEAFNLITVERTVEYVGGVHDSKDRNLSMEPSMSQQETLPKRYGLMTLNEL